MPRAQTTIDFAVGVSIFLVTVAFAFTFVPGIVDPFAGPGSANPVTANRVADSLAQDRLADVDSPYALNESKVAAFFPADEATLGDEFGLRATTDVNVTLETEDGTFTAGDPVPQSESVTVAWRDVTYDGDHAELTVRVW